MSVRRSFYSQEPEIYRGETARLYQAAHPTTLGWDAAMTPRKWRTIYASNQFQPTSLYNSTRTSITSLGSNVMQEWIGKYFIPVDSSPQDPSKDNYVMEYDVMRKSGMYSYRILYAVRYTTKNGYHPTGQTKDTYVIKSKPAIEGRPGQMNLILDTNNLILDVQYW